MATLHRLLLLLLCSVVFFKSFVSTYPTEGGIPDPHELEQWLKQRSSGFVEDVEHFDAGVTLDKRISLGACFSSLCCLTSDDDTDNEMAYVCPTTWPTLDDLKSQIQAKGNVGTKISFFYTGLGGGSAQTLAGNWANCHTQYVPESPGFVTWDGIVDDGWYLAQAQALANIFGGLNNIDPFQKLLSQAFAEVTSGDVYVFTPTGYDLNDPPIEDAATTIAWVGWEYPALTRNPNVGTIYRVDPRTGQDQERYVLWTQADGPSPNAPLGLYNAPDPPTS